MNYCWVNELDFTFSCIDRLVFHIPTQNVDYFNWSRFHCCLLTNHRFFHYFLASNAHIPILLTHWLFPQTNQIITFWSIPLAAVDEPEFTEIIDNVTVPAGRNVRMACSVRNLGSFKVSVTKCMKKLHLTNE